MKNADANLTTSSRWKADQSWFSGEPGVEKSCIARLRRPLAAKPLQTAASRHKRVERRVKTVTLVPLCMRFSHPEADLRCFHHEHATAYTAVNDDAVESIRSRVDCIESRI